MEEDVQTQLVKLIPLAERILNNCREIVHEYNVRQIKDCDQSIERLHSKLKEIENILTEVGSEIFTDTVIDEEVSEE